MDIPADWIRESEIAALAGVRDASHRNLLNWRHHGLLPAPMIRPLGVGIGNEAVYPPIAVEMVRRLHELRRQSRDMDEWRWQLWLGGYPVEIVGWCRRRLEAFAPTISGMGEKQFAKIATRKPTKRGDPRRIVYQRLSTREWYALGAWTTAVAVGACSPARLFDEAVLPLATLCGRKDATGAAVVQNIMGIGTLIAVLDEAGEAELLRIREDIRTIARLGNSRSGVRAMLSAWWKSMDARAVLLPALIGLRRSPGHQGSLVEALGSLEE